MVCWAADLKAKELYHLLSRSIHPFVLKGGMGGTRLHAIDQVCTNDADSANNADEQCLEIPHVGRLECRSFSEDQGIVF